MVRSAKSDPMEKIRFGMAWIEPTGLKDDQELGTGSVTMENLPKLSAKVGFHDIQFPKRNTNKIQYREGNSPDVYSISAGLSTMEDIVMSRGLLPNAKNFAELAAWAALVHSAGDTTSRLNFNAGLSDKKATGNNEYRKDVIIFMYDRSGVIKRAWKLYNAFPVNYTPGSDLNAGEDGEKSLEQLTLAYEDFIEIAPGAGTETPPGDDPEFIKTEG